MISLERIGLAATVLEAVLKCHFPTLLTSAVSVAEGRRKAPCQYVKYARSGRVADAVREHSFCSSPTRSGSAALERIALPFFVPLTPARWQAKSLAANFSALQGCGVAVPAEPIQNQRQNSQVAEIVRESAPVLWFRSFASRDVRACVCAGPCAYMCARKSRTSEPANNIYVYQLVSGSIVGSERFSPEPAPRGAGTAHGFAPISNKIVGRYARSGADRARRGLMRSRAGERFGVFGLGATADRAGCSSSTRRARNGGNASVFVGASSVVGTPMLERMTQTRGNAPFSAADRLPSGKARGTPPCPLSRAQPPSWRWRSSVSDFGSASPLLNAGPMRTLEKLARGQFRRAGSGEASRSTAIPTRMSGRGGGDAAGKLRRMTCMGGGISRVK